MELGKIVGDRRYLLHAVDTSEFQNELELVVGGKSEESAHYRVPAILVPEYDNPNNRRAVRIEIDDYLVGYLDRVSAAGFFDKFKRRKAMPCSCDALIVGGWHRSHGREPDGYFGVRLDIKTPMELWLPPQRSVISKIRREHVIGVGLLALLGFLAIAGHQEPSALPQPTMTAALADPTPTSSVDWGAERNRAAAERARVEQEHAAAAEAEAKRCALAGC
jgi:hypothetical protein